MKQKTVLLDPDGTLVPMDQDVFIKRCFGLLAGKPDQPEKLIEAVWTGTKAMVKNHGTAGLLLYDISLDRDAGVVSDSTGNRCRYSHTEGMRG